MRALASAEVLTANNANSVKEQNKSQTRVRDLRKTMARLRLNIISSKKSEPSSPIQHTEVRKQSSENPDSDICDRHFLFDKRWKNGIYYKNYLKDKEQLMKPSLPPVSQGHPVHRYNYLNRFPHQKKGLYKMTSQCTFGAYDSYEFPQVLLTVTTPPISRRHQFSENFKNRPRKNRVQGFFVYKNTTQLYPDPVSGAPAPFIQRISEISSLEEETVRQERIKNLKKNKKQDQ